MGRRGNVSHPPLTSLILPVPAFSSSHAGQRASQPELISEQVKRRKKKQVEGGHPDTGHRQLQQVISEVARAPKCVFVSMMVWQKRYKIHISLNSVIFTFFVYNTLSLSITCIRKKIPWRGNFSVVLGKMETFPRITGKLPFRGPSSPIFSKICLFFTVHHIYIYIYIYLCIHSI